MRELEAVMNALTDMDWSWWPFLFLRPAREAVMTTADVARMAVYFGVVFGVVLLPVLRVMGQAVPVATAALAIVGFGVVFFAVYRLTFAVCWNQRARRLQGARD